MVTTPFICTESFFLSPDLPDRADTDPVLSLIPPSTKSKLLAFGQSRARDMRTQNISMQIVSHVPVDVSPKQCQKINDQLASSIVMARDRFAGLALLPCEGKGKEAAEELGRCVSRHGFVGGVLGFRRSGCEMSPFEGLDDGIGNGGRFEGLWGVAERYRVPVFLRPVWLRRDEVLPSTLHPELREYQSSLPLPLLNSLTTHFHTTHAASPHLLLHLYLTGTFDRHPNLRLVLSQNGHSIPTLLPRIQTFISTASLHFPSGHQLTPTRSFLDVWQHNIYITTADTLDVAGLRALSEQIPIDRILFASNYPWEDRGSRVMGELREADVLSREEWERVAWRNAAVLLGLRGEGRGR